jgi:hypothetical protein
VTILAIDPGPTESAFVVWITGREIRSPLDDSGKTSNVRLLEDIDYAFRGQINQCVIEQMCCYGMPAGQEIFQTVRWAGRFEERFGADRVIYIPRLKVKQHLCHDSRAKDSNIRQALIDRFGKPGTKKAPGLLYGVSGDVWAALALAVTYVDQFAEEAPRNA